MATLAELLNRLDTKLGAPPLEAFDPVDVGEVPEIPSTSMTEFAAKTLEGINRFFGVPQVDEARPPTEAEQRFERQNIPTRVGSTIARTLSRGLFQVGAFLPTLGESIARPSTALPPEELEGVSPLAQRGKVLAETGRGLLNLPIDAIFQLAAPLRKTFGEVEEAGRRPSPEVINRVFRSILGETIEEKQAASLGRLAEAPETIPFGLGIAGGIAGLRGRTFRVSRGKPIRVAEPIPRVGGAVMKLPESQIRTKAGEFGGIELEPTLEKVDPTSKIKVPEARPQSDLQAEASSPIEIADRFLAVTRERKARIYESHLKADKWEKNFSEVERENAGALVEGIQNIRTGKVPKSTAKVRGLVREFSTATRQIRQDINKYLRNLGEEDYIGFIENYIPHFFADGSKKVKSTIRKWMLESPNAKERLLPTLKEAVDLGLTPLSQDVSLLYRMYGDINWRVAANKQIAELFKTATTGEGTKIASTKPHPTWERFNHPALAQIFETEKGIWIHPDVTRIAKQAFDNPLATRGKIGKAFDNINAAAKHGELLFSGFHAIALMESGQAVLARGKNPLRGMFMVGRDAQKLSNKRFILSFRAGKRFQEAHPEVVMDFIRDGLELRTASADIGAGILSRSLRQLEAKSRTVPVVGKPLSYFPRKLRQGIDLMNRGLWEQIHEGYKIASHYDLLQRELGRLPEDAPTSVRVAIREKVASVLNDAFGGQEWESKLWLTPKGLQYARRTFLAPDWTLSNIRIFGRGFKEIKNPVVRRMWFTYWRNMAGSIFATTQALNLWSTGHPTWENEVGHKLNIDYTALYNEIEKIKAKAIPGYEFDPNDKTRRYIRIAKQAREILSWFEDPLKIAGSKASPLVRETFKQATGHQAGSGFQAEWTREQQRFWESWVPNRFKSMAELFTPFSLRGNQFAFSLPASKGMTPFKAVRAFQRALDAKEWTVFGKTVQDWEAIDAIAQAADLNGLQTEQLYTAAMGSVRGKYYGRYFEALEKEDFKKADEIALILQNLGATEETVKQSAKRRGLIK